jgi:hypothetical protein
MINFIKFKIYKNLGYFLSITISISFTIGHKKLKFDYDYD